ncbi:MAG TPA: cupin domain-containing protein [Micromonosporaceae bacterium]|nr:cupin domain-containing protein [Micromonosporaceae bacterium]
MRRCVAVAPDAFAREHYGRAPLLSRAEELAAAGAPAGFADLLSPDDVDELLSRRGLRTPFLRIAKDGTVLPATAFTGFDPLERQPWGAHADEVATAATGPSTMDEVLAPGDALYLPRGWLHAAQALGGPSLHLTVGLRGLTRYAIVEALLATASEVPALRAGPPLGADLTDPAQLRPELAAAVAALRDWLDRADPQAVAAALRQRVWTATRPAPIRPLAQAAAAEAVHRDTVLAPRRGLRWRLVPEGPDRVALELPDRTLSLPAYCAEAVCALLGGPEVRAGDLPGLDPADRLVLARRLLREAVAVPAEKA